MYQTSRREAWEDYVVVHMSFRGSSSRPPCANLLARGSSSHLTSSPPSVTSARTKTLAAHSGPTIPSDNMDQLVREVESEEIRY